MEGFCPCNGCTEPTVLAGLELATLKGCYTEFGVFRGNSFAAAMDFISKDIRGLITCCYGFDSFIGFPAPSSDKDGPYKQGIMSDTSYEDVYTKIKGLNTGIDFQLVKGFFNETFPTIDLPLISVCLVDCDSYSSSKSVLEYVAPKMQDGSIIIFDDYHLHDAGQKTAVDEFLAAGHSLEFVKEVVSPDWHVPIYIWRK